MLTATPRQSSASFDSETTPLLPQGRPRLDGPLQAKTSKQNDAPSRRQNITQRLKAAGRLAAAEALRGAKKGFDLGHDSLIIPIPITTPLGALICAGKGARKGWVTARNEQKNNSPVQAPQVLPATVEAQALLQK